MANERGKSIDNTHLSIDTAEERLLIHRDYISHVFRWTHAAKVIGTSQRYQTASVLDIGCGIDLPLARMLYSNKFIVKDYIGIDYNKSAKFKMGMFKEDGKFPANAYGSVDFATNQVIVRAPEFGEIKEPLVLYVDGDNFEGEHPLPTFFTSFEVLEHVEPGHARAMLKKIHILMQYSLMSGRTPIGYISTPCYDASVGAAANHVNEMKREALGALLEDLGFEIFENFGTFASIRDYRDRMFKEIPGSQEVYSRLSKYYDTNVLANIFAPMVPQYARNNIWGIRPAETNVETATKARKFPRLEDVKGPWTSSERWEELNLDIHPYVVTP